MASRRAVIQDFYRTPQDGRTLSLLLKSVAAASLDQFAFAGAKVMDSVVVRTDLNGYSEWARDRSIPERVALLDTFFSSVVPELSKYHGVFFRDEGDCIVSLFTAYFGGPPTTDGIEQFCMTTGGRLYGLPQLSVKTVVVRGNVAIFQKAHEVGTQDWSAEGDAFVRAARLEAAVPSTPAITYFADEYDAGFKTTNLVATPAPPGSWTVKRESLQVPGLALNGGWADVVVLRARD